MFVRTVGQNLRRLRKRLGKAWTQGKLAAVIGHVNSTNVSNWEKDRVFPDEETVKKLAAALRCEPHEILEGVRFAYDDLRNPAQLSAVDGQDVNDSSKDEPVASGTSVAVRAQHGSPISTSRRIIDERSKSQLRELATAIIEVVSEASSPQRKARSSSTDRSTPLRRGRKPR